MLFTLLGMVTDVRSLQSARNNFPIDVTSLGITVFIQPCIRLLVAVSIIALQLLRESYFVFPLSTEIDVRLEQNPKGVSPIDVTLLGISMDVSLEQKLKAPSPIDVTLWGIVTDVKLKQLEKAFFPIVVTPLPIVTYFNSVHAAKADSPIDVTLLGMVTDVRMPLLEKADAPIDVTL